MKYVLFFLHFEARVWCHHKKKFTFAISSPDEFLVVILWRYVHVILYQGHYIHERGSKNGKRVQCNMVRDAALFTFHVRCRRGEMCIGHGHRCVGPIANLKGHYFQTSLSVCLSVCLWLALLPFNVDRFWWNLVTRTLLWSSLAATIMVQIGRRGTVRRLFWKFQKNSQKSQNSNYKKFWSIFFALLRVVCVCAQKIGSV